MPGVTVPFIDLRRQHQRLAQELEPAVQRILRDGHFILGPEVEAFEREFAAACGTRVAVGVASCTDALRLALEAAGVGAGDEVITSPLTFVATAEMISQLGATPVFVDIDLATFCLDPSLVAAAITPRTRAILPVHLYGHPAAMGPLLALAQARGVPVIEDAAQAAGAQWRGRSVGGLGLAGCFSFFPTKNLGAAGDGGCVTTNDPAVADRVRVLRQHGSRKKYQHEALGWSSRLDELQAGILRVKLRHLGAWTQRRRELAARYHAAFADLPLVTPIEASDVRSAFHLYTVRTPQRDALKQALADRGIQTMVHYPIPLHRQPIYQAFARQSLPASEQAAREVLCLPLFPELTDDEHQTVIDAVRAFPWDAPVQPREPAARAPAA